MSLRRFTLEGDLSREDCRLRACTDAGEWKALMDDSLIDYIGRRLMHDINNAEDFIDPRSAPPSVEARRAGDHQINRIVEELTLALGSSGDARQTHLRTARVLLAMIAPTD